MDWQSSLWIDPKLWMPWTLVPSHQSIPVLQFCPTRSGSSRFSIPPRNSSCKSEREKEDRTKKKKEEGILRLSSFFFVSTSSSSSWVKAFFESTVGLVFSGGLRDFHRYDSTIQEVLGRMVWQQQSACSFSWELLCSSFLSWYLFFSLSFNLHFQN